MLQSNLPEKKCIETAEPVGLLNGPALLSRSAQCAVKAARL